MKEGKKPKYNTWQNVWFMLGRAWRTSRGVPLLAAVLAALGVAMNLLELFVTPALLRAVETAGTPWELAYVVLFFAAGFIVADGMTAYVEQNAQFGRIHVRSNLLRDCTVKTCRMSFPKIEDPVCLERRARAADAMSNNHSATEEIWNTLTELMKNGVCFCIWLGLLAQLHPALVGVTVILCCLDYGVSNRANGWGYRRREEEDRYVHELWYVIGKAKDVKLAKDVHIFGMRKWLEDVFAKTLHSYGSFKSREERAYFGADVCGAVLTLLRNGLAYAWLIGQVLQGKLEAAQFVLYFTALSSFTEQVMGIFAAFLTLHRHSLDICRVRDFLEEPESFVFEEGRALPKAREKACSIELSDVCFRYAGADKNAIDHVSLRVGAGEKLAVVGLNGAGKTTLIKLICGFYDPTEGSVCLNGEDIRQYNRREYYEQFSAVFQEHSLLPGTVAENISQMPDGTDRQRVMDCAKRAGFAEKIASLPEGYETKLEKRVHLDAVELSGGEMQRLLMARALYKDAPVIVLDEPTAALDPLAENDVYQKYNDLTKGATSVFISHRLASTRFCDRIILLEEGRIVEEGTHEELMTRQGRYAKLFEVQSQYYKEGKGNGSF